MKTPSITERINALSAAHYPSKSTATYHGDFFDAYSEGYGECRQSAASLVALLEASHAELLRCLLKMMPQIITGTPTREQIIKSWQYEQSQGRGEADDVLAAYEAIANAEKLTTL